MHVADNVCVCVCVCVCVVCVCVCVCVVGGGGGCKTCVHVAMFVEGEAC